MDALADDLLYGADAIAAFLFGDPKLRRKVYHLRPKLPLFHMGNAICGRKSTLLQHVKNQEARAADKPLAPSLPAPPARKGRPRQRRRGSVRKADQRGALA
jgi:hypothetical protein